MTSIFPLFTGTEKITSYDFSSRERISIKQVLLLLIKVTGWTLLTANDWQDKSQRYDKVCYPKLLLLHISSFVDMDYNFITYEN